LGLQLQLTYWRCTKQDAATRTEGWKEMQGNGSTAAVCFPRKNSRTWTRYPVTCILFVQVL